MRQRGSESQARRTHLSRDAHHDVPGLVFWIDLLQQAGCVAHCWGGEEVGLHVLRLRQPCHRQFLQREEAHLGIMQLHPAASLAEACTLSIFAVAAHGAGGLRQRDDELNELGDESTLLDAGCGVSHCALFALPAGKGRGVSQPAAKKRRCERQAACASWFSPTGKLQGTPAVKHPGRESGS